jgi:dynamin family protein
LSAERILETNVVAELPWQGREPIRGTLQLRREALVLQPRTVRAPVHIPLAAVTRTAVETTLGVLPALQVWHRLRGEEVRSRFEFAGDVDEDAAAGPDLANRIGPGLARDAASIMEGGFRALGDSLRGGKRAMRQVAEGIARQEEYRLWTDAIGMAQAALAREDAREGGPSGSSETSAPPPTAPPPPPLVPFDAEPPQGDTGARLAWFNGDAARRLLACGARARELGVPGVPVIQPAYPLDSPTLRIVVAGEFSRGKSTVINALFGIHGEIALPTGMTPTTPLACAIRVPTLGESDGATISYRTARPPLQLSLEQFRAGVRLIEEGDQGSVPTPALHLDEARRVEVRITGAYLPAGVEIEDTPGLNEQAGRSAGALSALGRADLILFVLAADQLLGRLEQAVIDNLAAGYHRNVLFLVNFWDTIEDPAQQEVLRQRVEAILARFPGALQVPPLSEQGEGSAGRQPLPVCYLSALQAVRAQRQRKPAPEASGIPRLRAVLRDYLGPQSSALLLRARLGRGLRYLDALQPVVARAAASIVGPEPAQHETQQEARAAATLAARRQIEALPAVAQAAMSPVLAALRDRRDPALQRVAALLERAAAEGGQGRAVQEARQALGVALRTAVAQASDAVQQAVDLLVAQTRVAYMSRGLPAPALDAQIPPLPLALPERASAALLAAILEGAADHIETTLGAAADRLQIDLLAGLPEPGPVSSRPQPTADAGISVRRAALRSLEEDLVRLRVLLQRALDDA